ncbi:GNAT family N-acetyltransferase [Natronospora cellulosivora (SeqCode)]
MLTMNKNTFNIRKAIEGDVDKIYDLVQRAFSNYDANASNPALKESLQDIEYDIRNNIVIILEIDEELVGSLRLELEEERVHLKRFAIDPDYQKKGIGTKLYKRAEEEIIKRNINNIYLYATLENEKIVKFYKKLAFNCIDKDNSNGYLRGLWVKKINKK